MRNFSCLSITPIELEHPGLAVATARAGGVGILNREFCRDAKLLQAKKNLVQLLKQTGNGSAPGLRLRANQLKSSSMLLDLLQGEHWLVLCRWEAQSIEEVLASLPPNPRRTLLLEVTSASQLANLPGELNVQGLVARGNESGGWAGEDPAFILSQKLLAAQPLPIYVQGGIGPHTAAACLAAGAAGVCLDDQLLLMPESPLPPAWASSLMKLNGNNSVLVGERIGAACRFLVRPDLRAATELQLEAGRAEMESPESYHTEAADCPATSWPEKANSVLGWGPPEESVWPIGQAIGLAAQLREKFGTTGRFIQAILSSATGSVDSARRLRLLGPDSPLATSHGTRYPIVQGPMTRVSDTAEFANAVAEAGALPLVALALMKEEEARTLLQATADLLGEKPWGVGILGFVSEELREQQLRAVHEVKPPFALIAGGRPDQSIQLTAQGIATYIHVPTSGLLRSFFARGARRFVFEGRECGGHVGPLTSFALWETVIEALLDGVNEKDAADVHVLFAGGIHDARSATMVSAMAAPLAARGMKVGVLMGTAYLFTKEAVARGGILPTFQHQAIACDRTTLLETGPGHAIRCVTTPFLREFYSARREGIRSGASAAQLKQTLESLTVGRLRIASKGLQRNGGSLQSVGEEEQLSQGIYMIGQVATMQHSVRSMHELHREVSEGSLELLGDELTTKKMILPAEKPSEIAIIGIGLLLPGAQNSSDFWYNIVHQVNSISEIPRGRWDWRLFYDADRKVPDKIYARWGGFIDAVPFDPLRFGIPPNSLKSISCTQLLTLEAVQRALEDAGYESGGFDKEHTSVILGSADAGSVMCNALVARTMLPLLLGTAPAEILERLPDWTGETFPGTLTNVTAGRVANRLDLGGANFTVDAACASSLAAIDLAVASLEAGRCNVAITGGVDFSQSPYFYIAFSKTQALSPKGKALAFDKAADGIVISEGAAVLVLKRLADAERDGDRIYAVIKGVASSSDGKALGLTAPRPIGQMRAVDRATSKAGIGLASIGLYEAHGTGTVVGDQAELETIITSLQNDQAPRDACAIGSIKTLVGHTKMAAGAVGITKAALSLYHKVLPPHWGVKDPLPAISETDSPVYLLTEARPWLVHPDHPRRSGVSAFGFGGTNTHAVIEEYRGEVCRRAPGGAAWPFELFAFTGGDRPSVIQEVQRLLDAVEAGAEVRLRDLAFTTAGRMGGKAELGEVRLSLVVASIEQLREGLHLALTALEEPARELPPNVILTTVDSPAPGVAFCFPGQGSQYPGMARELALYFDEMRVAIELADEILRGKYPQLLSQYIYPPAGFTEAERAQQNEALTATQVAQPAIGTVSAGFLQVMKRLGVVPSMACGHSFGEFSALYAAEALSLDEFMQLSEARGRLMGSGGGSAGVMAALIVPREEVEQVLSHFPSVVVANHNTPSQTVISGPSEEVRKVIEQLTADDKCRMLPVSDAFHSPMMEHANAPLAEAIKSCAWRSPSLPVYSNVDGRPYAQEVAVLTEQLSRHLLSSVEFLAQIERMYADGARVFLELGPKGVLTGLIKQILQGRPHVAVSLEGNGAGLRGFLLAVASLFNHGVELNVLALFAARDAKQLDFIQLAQQGSGRKSDESAWFLDGSGVRSQSEPSTLIGRTPFLTQDDMDKTMEVSFKPTPNGDHLTPSQSIQPKVRTPSSDPPTLATSAQGSVVAAYQAYQETMQRFLSVQEEALKQFLTLSSNAHELPTGNSPESGTQSASLQHLNRHTRHASEQLDREVNGDGDSFPHRAPASAGVDSSPKPLPETSRVDGDIPVASREPLLDRDSLTRTIVRITKEHTGYPEEMLGLEMDLEAELGIDSIKRIELLEAFQKELPATLSVKMQEQIERLTKVRSLSELLDHLLEWMEGLASESPRQPEVRSATPLKLPETLVVNRDDSSRACPRSIVATHAEPLSPGRAQQLEGLFILSADQLSVARHLGEAMMSRGAVVAILDGDTLASPPQLARAVEELVGIHKQVTGVLHLAGLSSAEMPKDFAEWRRLTQIQSKSLFQILRCCACGPGKERPKFVFSASLFGGSFGRGEEQGSGLPASGSGSGLLKTLSEEWPGVTAKAIDFDPTLSPREIAGRLLEELVAADNQLEVGYPSGQRTVFRTIPAPLTSTDARSRLRPASDWVVLATGGGRGITAEVLRSFAVPRMRVILVGRTPLDQDEPSDTAGSIDISQLREILIARHNGKPLVPAQIERELQSLLRQRETKRNLAELGRAGVNVEYRAVDVRNATAFGALIEEIYERYGRLDAVLHGAGIIDDKLLEDKSVDSFDKVFDTKVDSLFILDRLLRPSSLKLLAFFSSVAARWGNRGQSDYAAANEVMNRFAWRLSHKHPTARVVAINWGPWAGAGLASAGVNRQFKERGLIPITAEEGCEFFMNEVTFGADVEVVAGEGPWLSEPIEHYDLGELLMGMNELSENFWMM